MDHQSHRQYDPFIIISFFFKICSLDFSDFLDGGGEPDTVCILLFVKITFLPKIWANGNKMGLNMTISLFS